MSQLHEAIWVALKDAGIVIAFPQLDLHVKDLCRPDGESAAPVAVGEVELEQG